MWLSTRFALDKKTRSEVKILFCQIAGGENAIISTEPAMETFAMLHPVYTNTGLTTGLAVCICNYYYDE